MLQPALDSKTFNIDLLVPNEGKYKEMGLQEVTSLSIFEPNSDVFARDGLFSPYIFGELGTDVRLTRPGYVNFKCKVFHPLVYSCICNLGKRYEEILSGNAKAIFNPKTKDFELTTDDSGETGFDFFCRHVDELVYERNESKIRDFKIGLVDKYGRNSGLISEWLVLPAGLRDYTIDDKGVPSEDDINKLYRSLIGLANRMKRINVADPTYTLYLDPIRYKVQRVLYDIYKYIQNLIDGKSKFIQSKWASRGCEYAVSNVITATPTLVKDLDDETTKIGFNSTVVGVFQYLKACGPVVYNKLMNKFIGRVFGSDSYKTRLINPKTLKTELVELKTKTRQEWTNMEGVNNIVNKLAQDVIKNEYVKLDGYYLALVLDKISEVEIYFDPNELPEEYSLNKPENFKKFKEGVEAHSFDFKYNVRPITYVELFYLSIVDIVKNYPALVTRYPITGGGSIYPTYPYLKTTIKGRKVKYNIGHMEEGEAPEYPILGLDYIRSQSVHITHLDKLGADHDGDVMSFILLFSEEAIKEVNHFLGSKDYYLDSSGNFNYSSATNVINIVITHMTE